MVSSSFINASFLRIQACPHPNSTMKYGSNYSNVFHRIKRCLQTNKRVKNEPGIITSPSLPLYTPAPEVPPFLRYRRATRQKKSSIHRCLFIDEVLRKIIAHLPDDRSRLYIGLCCRAFLEPAMDSLWCELPCFRPLVRCLSKEIISRASSAARSVSELGLIPLYLGH